MAELARDIAARNRAGEPVALTSVCSAHAEVLTICLAHAARAGVPLAIEATSNQVNHQGGYTGQSPADFATAARAMAEAAGARIVLGGDHLGPQAWRAQPAAEAMAEARAMVAAYAAAGFTKIHLDCSEGCAGEPAQLPDAVTAERSADLARVARDHAPDPEALLFVIGTEVPPPGGARLDEDGDIPATTPESAAATLAAHRAAFEQAGLADLLPRIAGLVVQPGVEFSPMAVHHLPRDRDPGLRAALAGWPGVTLEAHSTDYQRPEAYARLAELGFGFHKVGPALTFAWRQAVYGLDLLRTMLGQTPEETLPGLMERLMLDDPRHWSGHYHGQPRDRRIARHFGLADRIRYYWPAQPAQRAVARLRADLADMPLPAPMLAQVFCDETIARAEALGGLSPDTLIAAEVDRALAPYLQVAPR
ncbi:class II D-tagatose-bisphosphate aldolase non-catalytic subunit [Roseisalinus antarcticus]|nr:class II D-tagatose-bisphosphate aldolase, non-catalytic subunit [Roseisalinus antarcticus]